jgi:hypothetical protein
MSYQLYRNTTLGHTLQEALDELMQMQMLSPNLALRVLLQVGALPSTLIVPDTLTSNLCSLTSQSTVRCLTEFAIRSTSRQRS